MLNFSFINLGQAPFVGIVAASRRGSAFIQKRRLRRRRNVAHRAVHSCRARFIAIADANRVDPKLLTKIASRPQLSEGVTNILIKRGRPAIQRKILDNPNARVSEEGFARLVSAVNGDKSFATAVAARQDCPAELRVRLDRVLSE